MGALLLGVLGFGVAWGQAAGDQKESSSVRQSSSSSSSDTPAPQIQESTSASHARIAQAAVGGSAIMLDSSEALFDMAVALNACGYDAGLRESHPVRGVIRQEVNAELEGSAGARDARDAICTFIRQHSLTDPGQALAQYVSLALYTLPPPDLAASVDVADLPPDANQVVGILPLLRTFNEQVHLHILWVKHIPDYAAITNTIHDPLTKMIFSSNVYLRLPVSSYEGRRFLVFVEPMLAPSVVNARIYADDYIAVTSPTPADGINMHDVRHVYLQYMVEPLIYSRATAMARLMPLLKPVAGAPIDFIYKSDITAFITECLIRAIEARTLEFDFPAPVKPAGAANRSEAQVRYGQEMAAYEKKTEDLRRQLMVKDMREGWALTAYFYEKLTAEEHESASLKENIGEMVYGMEITREEARERTIDFLPAGTESGIRRVAAPLTGLQMAQKMMMKGDLDGAEAAAEKVLDDPKGDQGEAHYVLGQVALIEKLPEEAVHQFGEAIAVSKDPRTLAWSHIYLGRLYDTQSEPDRAKAVAEYKAALTVRDGAPDTKAAAEQGLKKAFVSPHVSEKPAEDEDLDPTGKAAKEAYKPEPLTPVK